MFNSGVYVAMAIGRERERQAFEELCDKFPEKAQQMRKDRAEKKEKEREIREQHHRDMQVAEAGKTEVTVNNYGYWL